MLALVLGGMLGVGLAFLRTHLLPWSRAAEQTGVQAIIAPAGREGDAGAVVGNLALSLVRSGRRVALVDADLVRVTATRLLDVAAHGCAVVVGTVLADTPGPGQRPTREDTAGQATADRGQRPRTIKTTSGRADEESMGLVQVWSAPLSRQTPWSLPPCSHASGSVASSSPPRCSPP